LGEDEDAFPGSAPHEFVEQDSDFEGLECGLVLDGLAVGGGLVSEDDLVDSGVCGAQESFDVEAGAQVVSGGIGFELCVFGSDEFDGFEIGPEDPGSAPCDSGETDAVDSVTFAGAFGASNKPLFAAALDAGSGGWWSEEWHGVDRPERLRGVCGITACAVREWPLGDCDRRTL
jgi:hypothetical protein